MNHTKIYFDESRNTGEIKLKENKLNYNEQRYFILVGYIEDDEITNKYRKFKEKYLNILYPNNESEEIKGTDLLTRSNNHLLNEFINDFIHGSNLLITIYDKKFFVLTNLLVWLLGIPFKDHYFSDFMKFNEFLIKIDEEFLGIFINTINYKTKENIKKFIEYVISYDYKECITSQLEIQIRDEFVSLVKSLFEIGEGYIEMLEDNIVAESIRIDKKNRNNIVNLTALGETILLYKLNNGSSNSSFKIYHDNIETVQKYMDYYLKKVDIVLDFIDSKNNLAIQLADNVASILGKFINNILPIQSDNSIKIALSKDMEWTRKNLTKIFNTVYIQNIKMVIHLREQAFLNTYCNTNINKLYNFKSELLLNLDRRFLQELDNHKTLADTDKLFRF